MRYKWLLILAIVVVMSGCSLAEDYWVIKGLFESGDCQFEATHETERFKDERRADAVMSALEGKTTAVVSSVETKTRKVNPPAPFDMTALQIAAAAEGIKPKACMNLAESLYLAGYITYPRTDNTVYPPSANLSSIVAALSQNPAYASTCKSILSRPSITATRGKKMTTDHPPIYPLRVAGPDTLPAAQYKLYNLIARRFLATLSPAAVLEDTVIRLRVDSEPFVVKGEITVVPGYREIYPFGTKKDAQLPTVKEGKIVAFLGATCTQKQTEPPARFSQGRLIAEMEKLGLGTKSTRAAIIDRLEQCGYIEGDPVVPTELGCAVIAVFEQFAPHISQPQMTASLEEKMLEIVDGKMTRKAVFADSRRLLAQELNALMPAKE